MSEPLQSEHAKVASRLLEQAKSGQLDLPQGSMALLQKAGEAAIAGDLAGAVTVLRQVIPTPSVGGQGALKKLLAMLLYAQAVEKVNAVVPAIDHATRGIQPRIKRQVDDFLTGQSDGSMWPGALVLIGLALMVAAGLGLGRALGYLGGALIVCGSLLLPLLRAVAKWFAGLNITYDPSRGFGSPCTLCRRPADSTVTVSDKQHTLCSSHSRQLKEITQQAPALGASTALALDAADSELAEASSLDGSSQSIKDASRNVRQLVERFKTAIAAAKAAGAPAKKAGASAPDRPARGSVREQLEAVCAPRGVVARLVEFFFEGRIRRGKVNFELAVIGLAVVLGVGVWSAYRAGSYGWLIAGAVVLLVALLLCLRPLTFAVTSHRNDRSSAMAEVARVPVRLAALMALIHTTETLARRAAECADGAARATEEELLRHALAQIEQVDVGAFEIAQSCLYMLDHPEDQKTLGALLQVLRWYERKPGLDEESRSSFIAGRHILVQSLGEAAVARAEAATAQAAEAEHAVTRGNA